MIALLNTYGEFLSHVENMGALAFSGKFVEGFPKLQDLTVLEQWHTGDQDTDPWQWKDRAAAEHRLAFGCLLAGRKGFISREMYPYFYAACCSEYSIEERFASGEVSRDKMSVYKLFEGGAELTTGEIRRALGVTKKHGASRADAVVASLQSEFLISVCGNRRKIDKDGQEYGWASNAYCLTEIWAGDWLCNLPERDEAREHILTHFASQGVDRQELGKTLFGKEWE